MRNRAALCALLLAGTLVTCVLAPGLGLGGQLHTLTSVAVAGEQAPDPAQACCASLATATLPFLMVTMSGW